MHVSHKQLHTTGTERFYASAPRALPASYHPFPSLPALVSSPSALQRSPHSISFYAHPLSLPLPETLVRSRPHRRRGLIIISQARPHQETWLLMREKSILLSLLCLFVSTLSRSASTYLSSRCSYPPLPSPSSPLF